MQQSKEKKIWIDLDNSPHVPFFIPIMRELKSKGYELRLTARDCSQTCGMADMFGLQYLRVGKHYGKNKVLKVYGTILRALQLANEVRNKGIRLAVSHGSRSQMFASFLLGIPSVAIMDYEYTRGFVKPNWVIMPGIIPVDKVKFDNNHVFTYPGIKEDVYVPDFVPDPNIKKDLGLNEKEIVVTIRPPATEAHYHNPQSEALFLTAVNYLGKQGNVKMVILPRYDVQRLSIRNQWPEWCENGKVIIPEHVLDGLNLIWFSDLVISGGGTMNREAAALGVPVYSIFRGKLGAVDRYLNEKGRLTLLEDSSDIPKKIRLEKRQRELQVNKNNRTLDSIINHVVKIMEKPPGV